MKLTCITSAVGTACRFEETHSLRSWTEYALTVVSERFRDYDGVDATAEVTSADGSVQYATALLSCDPTGQNRNRRYGTLLLSSPAVQTAFEDRMAELGVDFGPVMSEFRLKVTVHSSNAVIVDTAVPVVLAARIPGDGESSYGITVDDALSTVSKNPVQNRVVTLALDSYCSTSQVNELRRRVLDFRTRAEAVEAKGSKELSNFPSVFKPGVVAAIEAAISETMLEVIDAVAELARELADLHDGDGDAHPDIRDLIAGRVSDTAFRVHAHDSVIHVTADEAAGWNDVYDLIRFHVTDDFLHTNTAEKAQWDLRLSDEDSTFAEHDVEAIHASAALTKAWDGFVEKYGFHSSDTGTYPAGYGNLEHVSAADREKWSGISGTLETHMAEYGEDEDPDNPVAMHVYETERVAWGSFVDDLGYHIADDDIHVTAMEVAAWNARTSALDAHTEPGGNPHNLLFSDVGAYSYGQFDAAVHAALSAVIDALVAYIRSEYETLLTYKGAVESVINLPKPSSGAKPGWAYHVNKADRWIDMDGAEHFNRRLFVMDADREWKPVGVTITVDFSDISTHTGSGYRISAGVAAHASSGADGLHERMFSYQYGRVSPAIESLRTDAGVVGSSKADTLEFGLHEAGYNPHDDYVYNLAFSKVPESWFSRYRYLGTIGPFDGSLSGVSVFEGGPDDLEESGLETGARVWLTETREIYWLSPTGWRRTATESLPPSDLDAAIELSSRTGMRPGDFVIVRNTPVVYRYDGSAWVRYDTTSERGTRGYADVLDEDSILSLIAECDGGDDGVEYGAWMETVRSLIASSQLHSAVKFKGTIVASTEADVEARLAELAPSATVGDLYSVRGGCVMYVRDLGAWRRVGFGVNAEAIVASTGTAMVSYLLLHGSDNTAHHNAPWFGAWQRIRENLVDKKAEVFAREVTDAVNASAVIENGFYVDEDGFACTAGTSHIRLTDRAGDVNVPTYVGTARSVGSIGDTADAIAAKVETLMTGFVTQGNGIRFAYVDGSTVTDTLTGDFGEGIGVNASGNLVDPDGNEILDSHGNPIVSGYRLNATDFDARRLRVSWNAEVSVGRGLRWDPVGRFMWMPVYTVDTNGDETGLLDITDVTGIVPDLVTLIHTEAQENDRYWCSAAHMFFRYAGGTPSTGKSATGYADLVSQTLERGSDGNRKAYIAGTTVLGPEAYSIALLDRFWVTGTNQFFEFQGLPREIEKYAATVADLIGFVTHNAQIAVNDRYFCEETGTMYRYALNTAKVDDYDILKNLTFATVNPVTEGTRYYVTSVARLYEFGGIPEGIDPETWEPSHEHVSEDDLLSLGWTRVEIGADDLPTLGWVAEAFVQADLERFGWLVDQMTYLDVGRFCWAVADVSELNTPVTKSLVYEAVTGARPVADLEALCSVEDPVVGLVCYVEHVPLSHNAGSQLTTATFVYVGPSEDATGEFEPSDAEDLTNAVIEQEFGWRYVNAGGPVADVTAQQRFDQEIVEKNDTLVPSLFSPIQITPSRGEDGSLVTTVRCYKGVPQLNTYGSSPTLVAGFNGDQVLILRKTKPIVGEYVIESKDMGVDQVYCRDSGLWFYRGDITPDLVFARVKYSAEKFFADRYGIGIDDMEVYDRACQADAVSGYLWYNRTYYSAAKQKVFTLVLRFLIDNTGIHDIGWTVIDVTEERPKRTPIFSVRFDKSGQTYRRSRTFYGGFDPAEFFQRIRDGRFVVHVSCTAQDRMMISLAGGHGLRYEDNGLLAPTYSIDGTSWGESQTDVYYYDILSDMYHLEYTNKGETDSTDGMTLKNRVRASWNPFKFSACKFVTRRLVVPQYNDMLFRVPDTRTEDRNALEELAAGAVKYDAPVLVVFNPFQNKVFLYVLGSDTDVPSEDNLRGVRTLEGVPSSLSINGDHIYKKTSVQLRLTSVDARYPADCGFLLRVDGKVWFFRYSHLNFEFDLRATYSFRSRHLADNGTAATEAAYSPNSIGFDGVSKVVVTEDSYIHYLVVDEATKTLVPNPDMRTTLIHPVTHEVITNDSNAFTYIHPITDQVVEVPELAGMQPLARVGLRDGAIRVWRTTPVQAVFGKGAKLADDGVTYLANGEFVCTSYLQEGNLDRYQPSVLDYDGERTDFGGRPLKLKSLVLLSPSGRRFKFFIEGGGLKSQPL